MPPAAADLPGMRRPPRARGGPEQAASLVGRVLRPLSGALKPLPTIICTLPSTSVIYLDDPSYIDMIRYTYRCNGFPTNRTRDAQRPSYYAAAFLTFWIWDCLRSEGGTGAERRGTGRDGGERNGGERKGTEGNGGERRGTEGNGGERGRGERGGGTFPSPLKPALPLREARGGGATWRGA